MPSVTANVTEDEKRRLGVLAFIFQQKGKHTSVRELAGRGIRILLKRHKIEIDAVDRMQKLLPPTEKR